MLNLWSIIGLSWVKTIYINSVALALGDAKKPNFPGFAFKNKTWKNQCLLSNKYIIIKATSQKTIFLVDFHFGGSGNY